MVLGDVGQERNDTSRVNLLIHTCFFPTNKGFFRINTQNATDYAPQIKICRFLGDLNRNHL